MYDGAALFSQWAVAIRLANQTASKAIEWLLANYEDFTELDLSGNYTGTERRPGLLLCQFRLLTNVTRFSLVSVESSCAIAGIQFTRYC
jgi:Ran GTPase-activating protein (RanGAP) involved in mRNA processing and transport